MVENSVLVLGAGMIGVCVALELQARGADVTLVDRRGPGRETSYGNAGVIARSSLIPMNNPGLWAELPRLLSNRTASLRYDIPFLSRNLGWALGFMARARRKPFEETTKALDALIRLSTGLHRQLMLDAGIGGCLSDKGWMFLYRTEKGFSASRTSRETFDEFDIDCEVLDRDGIRGLEPCLKPVFSRALWIKDTVSVNNPGAVVTAYARLFAEGGGKILKQDMRRLTYKGGRWSVLDGAGNTHVADNVVVSLGPWSREFLERFGMKVPMGFERGYHMHFSGSDGGSTRLGRPIYDTVGGYVLSPMEQGLRLTTGVELTRHEAPKNPVQLDLAERWARQAITLGGRLDDDPWLGSRPTMPDSRPVIGTAPGHKGLYLAFGHQHVGFATGPGTAQVLADLMEHKPPGIDAAFFTPSRYIQYT